MCCLTAFECESLSASREPLCEMQRDVLSGLMTMRSSSVKCLRPIKCRRSSCAAGMKTNRPQRKLRIANESESFWSCSANGSAQGLSERVSEVNLMDIRDVRAQLAGDDSQIEVRLGSQDQGVRLSKALTVLDAQRQTPRGPLISYIDLTQGKRAIVGFSNREAIV